MVEIQLLKSPGNKKVHLTVKGHANKVVDSTEGEQVCAAVSVICATLRELLTEGGEISLESGQFEWKGYNFPPLDFAMKAFEILSLAYSEHLTLTIR